MSLLTSQHINVGDASPADAIFDFSYSALNGSTTKLVIGIAYNVLDTTDQTISSVTYDQGGNDESCTQIASTAAETVYGGDRYVRTDVWYLDSPTDGSAGTLRVVLAATPGNLTDLYVNIYEFDSEADTGFSGNVGTHSSNSADPSIDLATRDSDSIMLIVGAHQVADANPFTPGTDTVEDLDADGSATGAYFAGHEDGTGGTDTIDYTQTTGRRNAASAVEVQQTVGGAGDPEGPLVGGKLVSGGILQGRLVR